MTTSYPSLAKLAARQRSCLLTIRRASQLGLKVIVVDQNSSKQFISACQRAGASVSPQVARNAARARIEAISIAEKQSSGPIYWTEDDKPALISSLPLLANQLLRTKAEVAIPFRSSLSHYPQFEMAMYQFGRSLAEEHLRTQLDLFLGATLIRREASHHWTASTERDCQWCAIHRPRLSLLRDGATVLSMKVRFVRGRSLIEEERHEIEAARKRANQLNTLTQLFFDVMRHKLPQPAQAGNLICDRKTFEKMPG